MVTFAIVVIFFAIIQMPLIDKLNVFEGANIRENDDSFRFFIIRDDGRYKISKNVSWKWMEENGLIENGQLCGDKYTVAYITRIFAPELIRNGCTSIEIKLQADYEK
jgi:hypothetical protein